MDEQEFLARRFEEHRRHLRAVAFRVLGSASEADDAVQEAWLRASRAGTGGVENVAGWLTTIVGRVSLNMLRTRATRREESLGPVESGGTRRAAGGTGPEEEALLQDSVGLALLVVLDTLAPAERVAFVLHDMFDVPFPEIAPIVERSPTAARQLASRARRRVRGAADADGAPAGAGRAALADTVPGVLSANTGAGAPAGAPAATGDTARRREIVDAFLAAARGGDFDALLALLDPDVVLRADAAAVATGAAGEVRGAAAVAGTFAGRARAARPALVNGVPALVWMQHGQPKIVIGFTIADGVIVGIDLTGEPERLGGLELTLLDG